MIIGNKARKQYIKDDTNTVDEQQSHLIAEKSKILTSFYSKIYQLIFSNNTFSKAIVNDKICECLKVLKRTN